MVLEMNELLDLRIRSDTTFWIVHRSVTRTILLIIQHQNIGCHYKVV